MELIRQPAPKKRKAEKAGAGPVESPEAAGAAALPVGNQAAVGLLTREAPAPVRAGQVLSLQVSSGNRRVARLIEGDSSPFGDLEQMGAGAINELAIVHDLRRAIDDNPSLDSGIVKIDVVKKIKFEIVDHALTGLTPSQVKTVEDLYAKETGRSLRADLLDESKVKNNLNDAQETRIKALLAGTMLETGGAATMAVGMPGVDDKKVKLSGGDAAKVTARNRAMADAAEIKLLLDDGGDDSIKKLMSMLRKSGAANDYIASFFQSEFGKDLDDKLAGLSGNKGRRALALRYGNAERADAIAIDGVRERIEEFEQKNRVAMNMDFKGTLKEERDKLIAEIEDVLAGITQEAAAAGGSAQAARAAVAEQISKVLAIKVDDDADAESIGDLLKKTLKPQDVAVIEALKTGDPVEAAAARLARSDLADKANAKVVIDTLRGLHDRAEADVQRDIKATAMELKKSGMSPEELTAAIQVLASKADEETSLRAKEYTTRLKARIDQMADPDGGHHRFAQIIEDFDSGDKFVVTELVEQGGKLGGLEELQVAVGNDDLATVAKLLRNYAPAARRALLAEFDESPLNKAMGITLKGIVAPKTIKLLASQEPVKLPRSDAESEVAELIEAPDPGGEAELHWTYKWVRDTYQRALQEGGITGAIEDIGGRKVRTMLDDSANETTDAITMYKEAISPAERAEALRRLHNARAAITGDKAAYVADTDAARARIASAIALVVDIAVTILLPETAEFTTKIAAALIANIGSKVIIMQDQYTLSELKGDIVGSVVGLGLGTPSRLAGEEATKLIGSKLAAAAEKNGLKIAPELKALGSQAVKVGGEIAENYAAISGTNVALGRDPNEGVGEGTALGIGKGRFTHAVRSVVHPQAGAAGGSGGGGEEPTRRTTPTDEEQTQKTATPTVQDETPTAGSGDRGGGGGGGGTPTPRTTGTPTVKETPTVVDDDEPTVVEPTPMALADTEPAPGHGRTAVGTPSGPTHPRGGGGGGGGGRTPPAETVPERGVTPGAGGGHAPTPHPADHVSPTGETIPAGSRTVPHSGRTPYAPENVVTPYDYQAHMFVPRGGGMPSEAAPNAQELNPQAWQQIPPPIPVGGINQKLFLRDPLGLDLALQAGRGRGGDDVWPRHRHRAGRALPPGRPRRRARHRARPSHARDASRGLEQPKGLTPALGRHADVEREVQGDRPGGLRRVRQLAGQARHGRVRLLHRQPGPPRRELDGPDGERRAEARPDRPGRVDTADLQRGYEPQQRLTVGGRTFDDNTWVRDLPPRISVDLAERFRQLNDNFPEEHLREFLTQEDVQGLRDRLAILVQKLDSGRILVAPPPP